MCESSPTVHCINGIFVKIFFYKHTLTDDPSPFVPPSYFKTLTDSLKCTTVVPSPINGDFLNMRSLSSVTLELQQRPTTMELEGALNCYLRVNTSESHECQFWYAGHAGCMYMYVGIRF